MLTVTSAQTRAGNGPAGSGRKARGPPGPLIACHVPVAQSNSQNSTLAPPPPCSQINRIGYKPLCGTLKVKVVSLVPRPPLNSPTVMALLGSLAEVAQVTRKPSSLLTPQVWRPAVNST